ncbi:MAG: choice-of-anchor Q domain-containing protein [Solirubrobacteraceae bacterium]
MARRVVIVLALGCAGVFASAAVASAATITVTGTGDGSGTGSCPGSPCLLRQAINYVNADTQPDTIVLGTGPYGLTGGRLTISTSNPVTIAAAPSTTPVITQSGGSSLLHIEFGATVTISGITFQGGSAPAGQDGGAIYNEGTLSLTNDAFTNNTALGGTSAGPDGASGGYGGAIYNSGTLNVSGSTFSANIAGSGGAGSEYGGNGSGGGAIYSNGSLSVTGSAFTGNDAQGGAAAPESGGSEGAGGAIYAYYGAFATIGTSSFDGNEALAGQGASYTYGEGEAGEGGAIYDEEGTLTVTNSTFGATTPNQALASATVTDGPDSYGGYGGYGGAISADSANATLNGDTFNANVADGATSGNEEGGGGGSGGAVYSGYGQLVVHGGSFTADQAQGGTATSSTEAANGGDGGAIYSYASTTLIDDGSAFANDSAGGGGYGSADGGSGGQGGAIDSNSGQLMLSGGLTFTDDSAVTGAAKPGGSENYSTDAQGGALSIGGYVQASNTTFSGDSVTASNVVGAEGGYGGAVFIQEGAAGSFANDVFSGNSAAYAGTGASPDGGSGGAISAYGGGALAMTSDTFTANSAPNGYGGALYLESPATLTASTLTANSASEGGGLYADGLPVAVVNSTLDGNTAEATSPVGDGYGGGIYTSGGTLALASDTLLANQAYGSNDGGDLYDDGFMTIHDTIIAEGSLLGGGSGGENCYLDGAPPTDLGYNWEDRNTCGFAAAGDLVSQSDTDLGALASNGGPTQTVALLAGSSAIDAGDPAGCTDALGNVLTTDQRGTVRPQGPRCDIGAYEYVPPASNGGGGSGGGSTPVAPTLSGLAFSPQVFVTISGGGSTIDYTDTEAAITTFTVTGTFSGSRAARKGSPCKALPKDGKRPKHTTACTRTVDEGSFTHQDTAGANSVAFDGRVGGKTLPKGSYTVTVKASLDGLTSATQTATFKVVS